MQNLKEERAIGENTPTFSRPHPLPNYHYVRQSVDVPKTAAVQLPFRTYEFL